MNSEGGERAAIGDLLRIQGREGEGGGGSVTATSPAAWLHPGGGGDEGGSDGSATGDGDEGGSDGSASTSCSHP
jgi:hypothetical protein